MRTSRAGEAAFVGRTKMLAGVRSCLASGLHVHISGEAGVGKTALARRASADAIYLPNATPTKELLVNLLLELWKRGHYSPQGADDDEDAPDETGMRKRIRRLDLRSAGIAVCDALKGAEASEGQRCVVIVDEFDTATSATVRVVKQIGTCATLVCCTGAPKAAQKGFLFGCTRFDVPRLSSLDTEHLAGRLLDDYDDIAPKERPRLVRQIVEQSQGLPSITRELVKRAAAHGDLNAQAIRREDLHGAKPLDMTPGVLVVGIIFVGCRVAMRPLHDADMTVLFGFSGALLMLLRLFAFRAASWGSGSRR
jgi:hypothetical protein